MTNSITAAVSQETTRATERLLLDAYHGLVQHARIVRDPHASARNADDREHDAERIFAVAEQISRLATAVNGGLLDRLDAVAAVLDGTACIYCRREFGAGEPSRPIAAGPRGDVFAHSNHSDCGANAESEA